MRSSILYFLLLVLEILLNLDLDTSYKQGRFPKTLLKKSLELILSRGGIIAFDISLVLLLAKIDLIVEQQSCKKNMFRVCDTGYIKMIFALPPEVIALYI